MDTKPLTFVLSIGGSFNPIHCSHIEILEMAKKVLEMFFPSAQFIGFFAVALGSHVRKKCGKNLTIKKEHRLAMANIVSKETTWICPTSKCYGTVLNCLDEYLKQQPQSTWKDIFLVEVVGGDKVKPNRKSHGNKITVMISRKGYNEKLMEFRKRPSKKNGGIFSGMMVPKNTYLDGNDMFIELEGEDISSSRVRKVLERMQGATENSKKKILEELVEQDLMRPVIATYILEHWHDLYETAITSTVTTTDTTTTDTTNSLNSKT